MKPVPWFHVKVVAADVVPAVAVDVSAAAAGPDGRSFG